MEKYFKADEDDYLHYLTITKIPDSILEKWKPKSCPDFAIDEEDLKLSFSPVQAIDTDTCTFVPAGLKLSWNSIEGADGYEIYRSKDNINFQKMYSVAADIVCLAGQSQERKEKLQKYSWTDMDVANGETYSYRISVYRNQNYRYLSSITVTAYNTSRGMKLQWSKVKDVMGYDIYRCVYTGQLRKQVYSLFTRIKGSDCTQYIDTTVVDGCTYCYRIQAYDYDDKIKQEIHLSQGESGEIRCIAEIPEIILKNSDQGIIVSWKKIDGMEEYIIYRKPAPVQPGQSDSEDDFLEIARVHVSETSRYCDQNPGPGKGYIYYMDAIGADSRLSSQKKTMYAIKSPVVEYVKQTKAGKLSVKWIGDKNRNYEICYSDSKSFSKAETVDIAASVERVHYHGDKEALYKQIPVIAPKILKPIYYVRMREYMKSDSTVYFSAWSEVKEVLWNT